jgi:lipoprotein-anchoring transpeptidase ErfK/SrfK
MRWQQLKREIADKVSGSPALAGERPIILIDSAEQRLHWIDIDDNQQQSYPISTASKGMGNRVDSFKTPLGVHRVRQKIGGDQPCGMIFEGRVAIGQIAGSLDNRKKDEITSRILWLDGLEESVNKGGICDTFDRYIYIHGTSDEKRIGEPVSAGCIRMKNRDVIELFDAVMVDDIVLIR